jgi:hypothetical protein
MKHWRKTIMPGVAALAVIFLSGAGASGVDQMANVRTLNPTTVTTSSATASGRPSLDHLILHGLAKGSLPGGFPYDEPREERYDENYQETIYQPPSPTG